jgi:2-methylisocitrate lyase-like PEP mutase family enzyme
VTLTEAETAFHAAEEIQRTAYRAYTVANLALYRAEAAYLEAGGRCLFLPAETRLAHLRQRIDEWSRVLERGEDPAVVWPNYAKVSQP